MSVAQLIWSNPICASFALFQPVVGVASMEGHWIWEPVHVAVQTVLVEITVKVSYLVPEIMFCLNLD